MPLRKKIISWIGASLLFTLVQSPLRAEDAPAAEKWDQVRKSQRALLAEDANRPAAFYYNFGTSALQAGSVGEAYALLARAILANPLDSATRQNFRLAESKLPANTRAVCPAGWISWWPLSMRGVPTIGWLLLSLLLLLPWIYPARRSGHFRPSRWPWLAASIMALLITALSGWQDRSPAAGLLESEKLLSGPASTYPEISTLEAGSLVSVVETRDGWAKLRFIDPLGQESVGWAKPASILPLR